MSLIKTLNNTLHNRIYIDREFYEDTFLDIYNDPYIIFKNIQTGGSVNINEKFKKLKELLEFRKEYSLKVAVYSKSFKTLLYQKVFNYIFLTYKIPKIDTTYVFTNKIIDPKIFPSKNIYENKEITSKNDMIIYLYMDVNTATDYEDEYVKIIQNAINIIKFGSNMIIFAYFYLTPKLIKLYNFMFESFKDVEIIFPKRLALEQNTVFFILKNKTKNNTSVSLKENSMQSFLDKISDHLILEFELQIQLLNMKLVDRNLYSIVKYKLFSKLMN